MVGIFRLTGARCQNTFVLGFTLENIPNPIDRAFEGIEFHLQAPVKLVAVYPDQGSQENEDNPNPNIRRFRKWFQPEQLSGWLNVVVRSYTCHAIARREIRGSGGKCQSRVIFGRGIRRRVRGSGPRENLNFSIWRNSG